MNTDFRFSNLIGSVYRNGNVLFSADGNSVISPAGNKISVFDLKNNRSNAIETDFILNVKILALNANGMNLFMVNEGGEAAYVNMSTQTILYRHRSNMTVTDAKFSPNERCLAISRGGDVQIFLVAGFHSNQYNPFTLQETYHITSDKINQVEWSSDSRLVVISCADKVIRIVAGGTKLKNVHICALASHKWSVTASYFLQNSYDLISIDSRGLANFWVCSTTEQDIVEGDRKRRNDGVSRIQYRKEKRCNLLDNVIDDSSVMVTASCFHISSNVFVVAFSNGVFVLYEIPTFNLIHNLRVSDMRIHSLCFNKSGDWIAIACGCGFQGQLIVWEWQSETYVLKQQSHSENISSVAYSPDGSLIATGGEDGKVKVWSCNNSSCVVTFTEHSSVVSAVCWIPDGKALLSASYDGTVRARDLQRYRNFRTLVCPEETQLISLTTDSAGELVLASSKDIYTLYVWSLENGRLLDVLSGHSGPIVAIACHGNSLVSASSDKTLRVWNIVEASTAESIDLNDEALDVAYSPLGGIFAVLCLDSSISLFDSSSSQLGTIDTRLDIDAGRHSTDVIKKETSEKSKHFTCICFAADGELLIAAGRSNHVCIYNISEKILVKKIKLTENRSLEGVMLDVNRRNFTEFGNKELIDDSDSEEETYGKKRIKLAGTIHSDLSERRSKPEMRVQSLSFSPAGRSFAVCSTEGVSVYSLDHRLCFNPFELVLEVTPRNILHAIDENEYLKAVSMAIRLNDAKLIEKTLLSTPVEQINSVVRSMSFMHIEKLLYWLGEDCSEKVQCHVHFWQIWLKDVLFEFGRQLKSNRTANIAKLTAIEQRIANYNKLVTSLYDRNKYTLDYLLAVRGRTIKTTTES